MPVVEFAEGGLDSLVECEVEEQADAVPGVEEGCDPRYGVHGPVEAERDGAQQQAEVEGRKVGEGEKTRDDRGRPGGGIVGRCELGRVPPGYLQADEQGYEKTRSHHC